MNPPVWIEINSQTFNQNVETIKHIIGKTQIAAVLKSNAYGHGLMLIAALCESNPYINYLCVSKLSEALLLRKSGLLKPILVLSIIDADIQHAINNDIEFVAYDSHSAYIFNNAAAAQNAMIKVHIKVDTGLSRLGVSHRFFFDEIKNINTYKHIHIVGLMSHFAQSHEDRAYTGKQIQRFNYVIQQFVDARIPITHIHIANTAGALGYDLPECTMARIGLGLYGYWPSGLIKEMHTHELAPILVLKSRIISIKTLLAHEPVGYNQTYTTPQQTTIAILPIGYNEGYNLAFSNKASVMVHDTIAPIIGRISMNLTTIDITHIPQAQIGDEVTLIGNNSPIRVDDLALYTFSKNPREICVALAPSIPRILVETNELKKVSTNAKSSSILNKQISKDPNMLI